MKVITNGLSSCYSTRMHVIIEFPSSPPLIWRSEAYITDRNQTKILKGQANESDDFALE